MNKANRIASSSSSSSSCQQMKFAFRWCVCFVVGCAFTLLAILFWHPDRNCDPASSAAAAAAAIVTRNGSGAADCGRRPTYVVYGREIESGYLKHVFETFEAFGFVRRPLESPTWDVMWAHDYPFAELKSVLTNLTENQKVNHFPGSGYVTNKLQLAKTDSPFIPKAFEMPAQKEALLKFVAQHPGKMLVQKSNEHRGIRVRTLPRMDLSAAGTFVQEFVHPPMLIDGHKFDVGVYAILTSVQPLRLYTYNGDALFRFCPSEYYPFDERDRNKYVVGDDYLPLWRVPSLRKYFVDGGYSMKEAFNAYVRSTGHDPQPIWSRVEAAIRSVLLQKESSVVRSLKSYPSKRNFFELVRFDFALDRDMNVFIMEANMSPNLSSAHFPPNRLMYHQVLYNLFSLVGMARYGRPLPPDMEASAKNLMVHPDRCSSDACASCFSGQCRLCAKCLTADSAQYLRAAYIEHRNRRDCKRIFPPPVSEMKLTDNESTINYTPDNLLLMDWFKGKCELDKDWC